MSTLTNWNPWAAAPQSAAGIFRELELIERRLESLISRSLQGSSGSFGGGLSAFGPSAARTLSAPGANFTAWPEAIEAWSQGWQGSQGSGWEAFPPVDIHETEKEFVLKADLPQLEKSEVKVAARDGMLEISGEKKSQREQVGQQCYQMERAFGVFQRCFGLPPGADVAKAKARLREGVLTITIPKSSEATAQSVEIELT